ncbi:hypothetical protein ACPV5U_27985 [Vibrio mediterranei]
MNNSLLVNVSKYASSDRTSPIENFITEAFAWLLRNDKDVRRALSQLLKSKGTNKPIPFEQLPESDIFDTQVSFNGKYPDMLWSSHDDNWSVIFEHKVWSELHENQLSNYRNYAKEHLGKPFILVLITAHAGQHRQSPDIALCWYEVAEKISAIDSGDLKQKWIRDEFTELLKSNGLINMSPVNPLSIAYYFEAKRLENQLYDIAKRCINRDWPIQTFDCGSLYNRTPLQRNARGKSDAWGRIGLEFNNVTKEYSDGGWNPGIFCGFLIDGEDHCVGDLLEEHNEPLAVLIMDLDEPLHSILLSKGIFRKFVSEISLPTGWFLSDRTISNKTINSWHPLIIYRPLSGFIGSGTTVEQQSEEFFQQMAQLQQLLLDNDSFRAFCEEMHRLHEEQL